MLGVIGICRELAKPLKDKHNDIKLLEQAKK